MSYLVLARKLRPDRFKDLIGQQTIAQTLINAINIDRVAHAFLFTGPRGTGKTSCARILTKAINCKTPIDNEPCNKCENCLEIGQGISADVVEIDAASNRGIEHIRELRDGVKFSPAKCKYKTYIIDEVHMLTMESFNALLKTLEEPPSHVKFILATTDHHKVPITVISRCQRFDFSNISIEDIKTYLKKVAADESIKISDSALQIIARNSTGGLRDALTTMDMLISFSGENIEDEKVIEVLGLNDAREIDQLLKNIIDKDLAKVVEHFQKLNDKGRSIARLVTDLMTTIKNVSLVKSLPEEKIHWLNLLPDQLSLYKEMAENSTVGTLQQLFNIVLDVENQVRRSNQAKTCVEMGLVKMCSVESLAGVAEIISVLRNAGQQKKKKHRQQTPDLNKSTSVKSQITSTVNKKYQVSGPERNQPSKEWHRSEPVNFPAEPPEYLNNSYVQEPEPSEFTTSNKKKPSHQNNLTKPESRQKTDKPESKDFPAKRRQKTDNPASQDSSAKKWEAFVVSLEPSANKTLMSILRSSVVQELSDEKLVIGYKNAKLFTDEKRKQIEDAARDFFNPSIHVFYKESGEGIDDSLRNKHEVEQKKQIQLKKETAEKSARVQEILKMFPNSKISDIEIIEEKEDA